MTWADGFEILLGVGALALATFMVGFFRFVPILGQPDAPPTQMRLTVLPLIVLLTVVAGFSLICRGLGLI